jgi:GT2 family glycosyltransferase
MTAPPSVSILIASYNRSTLLRETLDALLDRLAAEPPEQALEILVIDNNSTDDTAAVVAEFARRDERIRYVRETQQGLSHARNRGIAEARHEVLVFVDDDVDFETNWLGELLRPFADPTVGMAGGRMLPYRMALPDWLPRRYYYLIGIVDLGETYGEVPEASGGNIAVRRAAFERAGTFDVALGRTGKKLLGNEEVDLSIRIRKAGFRIVYNPAAIVLHKIASKLNEQYILDFAYLAGYSDAAMDRRLKPGKFWLKYPFAQVNSFVNSVQGVGKRALSPDFLRYRYLKGYCSPVTP